jgi:hypothetical protein
LKKGGKKPRLNGPEITKPRAIKNDVVAPHHTVMARSTDSSIGDATEGTRNGAGKKERKPGLGRGNSQLSVEQREKALELIQAKPKPSYSAIARHVGCSLAAIKHLENVYNEQLDAAVYALGVYGESFRSELPPDERVKLYAAIARGEIDAKRAFSSLKSLQRVEELEGIVTKKEQKEAESKEAPQANGPVFVIQGATINVGLTDTKVIAPIDAIDVTPVPASGDESAG